jgi:hypothetical protein
MICGLAKKIDMRLVAAHLVDSHACVEINKFISSIFLSLTAMIGLEMPFVNVCPFDC